MRAHLWTKRFFKRPLRNGEDVVMETDHHCCCIRHQNGLQLCHRHELTTRFSLKEILNKHADYYIIGEKIQKYCIYLLLTFTNDQM